MLPVIIIAAVLILIAVRQTGNVKLQIWQIMLLGALGNLSTLGAASNVIISQNSEKRSGATLTFGEFVRVGVPLTVVNITVYWLFLSLP